MYRILIVEDDDRAAGLLEEHLRRFADEQGEALSVRRLSSALEFMEDKNADDLVFMDIQMPGINGFEAAEFLRQRDERTPLVFVTTLASQAVRGYEYDALAYLVKPVPYEALARCMARALRVMRRNATSSVVIKMRSGVRAIDVAQIVYVELEGHDLVYHLASGEKIQVRGSLAKAEEELPTSDFVRASSGLIVGLAHVRSVQGDEMRLSTGETCYLSRSRKRAATEAIANYLAGSL